MTTPFTLYHNPRCSKSRATLELLENHGIQPEIVRYLDTPPDRATLDRLLAALALSARDIVRRGEPELRELGVDPDRCDEDDLRTILVEHPRLIERPILLRQDEGRERARIGRPPETVLEILD